jgi:hypothetical protein
VSALDQKADTAAYKQTKISKTVVNFYLTAKGYEKLGFDTDRFTDGNMQDEDEDGDDEGKKYFVWQQ